MDLKNLFSKKTKADVGKEGAGAMTDKDKDKAVTDVKSGGSGGGVGKALWGVVLGAVVVSGLANVAMWMRVDSSVGESAMAADKALEKRLADFDAKMAAEPKSGAGGKEMESLKGIEERQKKMEARLDQLEAVLLEMAKSLGRIEAKSAGVK